jgi:hypothetical protein
MAVKFQLMFAALMSSPKFLHDPLWSKKELLIDYQVNSSLYKNHLL